MTVELAFAGAIYLVGAVFYLRHLRRTLPRADRLTCLAACATWPFAMFVEQLISRRVGAYPPARELTARRR